MTKYTYLLAILFVALLTSSCENDNQHNSPVTIAISPWAGYSFALIAKELGYLKTGNKNQIEFFINPTFSQAHAAYENGHVNGMFSTMIEVVEIAKKDIKTIHDLKGKTVGVEQQSVGMYMLNSTLEINDTSDNMEKALTDNINDAAITYSPYTQEIKHLAPNNKFHSGMIHDEIIDLLSIEEKTIHNKPEQIKLLINGWLKYYRYYIKNPDKANELLNRNPEFIDMNLPHDSNGITLANYNDQSYLFAPSGALEKSQFNILRQVKNKSSSYSNDSLTVFNASILQLHPKNNPGEH